MRSLVSVAVGLVAATSWTSVLSAPEGGERFMPPGAGAVVVWKSPGETLSKLEVLAAQSGAAPPRAEPGWMRAMMIAQNPALAEVDMNRSVWLAIMPQKSSEEEQKIVLAVPVNGKAELLKAEIQEDDVRVNVVDRWLVAVDAALPRSFSKPHARPFRLPKSIQQIRSMAGIAGHLKLDAFPEIRQALSGEASNDLADAPVSFQPLLMAANQISREQWDDLEAMNFGVGLSDLGVNMYGQTLPKPKSKLQKTNLKYQNTKTTLLRGLPGSGYAMLFGVRAPPEANTMTMSDYLSAVLSDSSGLDPKVESQLEKLEKISKASGDCSESTGGLTVGKTTTSIQFMSRSECRSAAQTVMTMRELVAWMNESFETLIPEEERKSSPKEIVALKKDTKVGGASLDSGQLQLPSEAQTSMGEAAAMLQKPFTFGALDAKTFAFAFGASDATLAKLVKAAKSGTAVPQTAVMTMSGSSLLSPRYAEAYLFVGPLINFAIAQGELADALGGMVAPLVVLMAQMPPIAMAAQSQPNGSHLYQLHFPQQLTQLVAALLQMQQMQ